MAKSIVAGQSFAFKVIGTDTAGNEPALSGVTVALSDPSMGVATVGSDGLNGLFVAGSVPGDVSIVATLGAVNSAPFGVTVAPAQTIIALRIEAI